MILLAITACSHASHPSSSSAPPRTVGTSTNVATTSTSVPYTGPQAISARVELPSHTLRVGSSIKGRVMISNHLGHSLHLIGCGGLFQVLLSNHTAQQQGGWLACAQRFTIPLEESSYPITVTTSYNDCTSEPHPPAGVLACGPNGQMPSLPPGEYQAKLAQSSNIAQTPAPIAIRVVP